MTLVYRLSIHINKSIACVNNIFLIHVVRRGIKTYNPVVHKYCIDMQLRLVIS